LANPAPGNPFAPKPGASKTPAKAADPFASATKVAAPKAANPFGPKAPVTPATAATSSYLGPKDSFGNAINRGVNNLGAIGATPKAQADNLGKIVNFGQGVINALGMAGTFVGGYLQKAGEQSAAVAAGKQPLNFGVMLANDIAAGSKNATAWTRNEKTIYGKDILESAGMPKDFGTVDVPILGKVNAPGLAFDILTDPTNFVPGKVLTTPIKATVIGAKTAIDAAKLAKIGSVSEKLVVGNGDAVKSIVKEGANPIVKAVQGKIAETAGNIAEKGAPLAEGSTAKALKPGSMALEQYTKKPLIEAKNIRSTGPMAKTLEENNARVISYKTVETAGAPSLSQIIGSAIEAGSKATKAVILGEVVNADLKQMAKAESRVAKAAVKAAKKNPQAVIDNVVTDIKPFEPHVTPDRTYVFDNNNVAHTFATPEEATSWTKEQAGAPAVINVTKGEKPIVDTGAVKAANPVDAVLMKMPTTTKQAKQAQVALDTVDKIAKTTTGTAVVDGAHVQKTYSDFTALVHGLKTGDQVDYTALESIAKAFDPQAKLIKQIEKTAKSGDAYAQLRDVLVEKGLQTVADTQERLKLMTAGVSLKAQGLAYADASAKYVEGRLSGALEPAAAISDSLRETAQANIARWMENPDTAKMMDDTLNNISRGMAGTFEYVQKIVQSPDFFEGASSLGDLAIRSTKKAYEAGSKAALLKQLNQSGEAKMLGSLFGIMRKRTKNGQLSVDEFIHRSTMMNDALLAVLGARNVYAKVEKLAKGNPHYVFLSMSDFAQVMKDTNVDLLKKALFPDISKATVKQTDTLSTISIGEAIRSVIEARERNLPINLDELAKNLQKRGELQVTWSAGFKAKVPAIAQELAEHITQPDIIARFEKIHATRALAAAEDSLRSAETISENIFASMIEGWKTNLGEGLDSIAARDQLVRNMFNEFVYASGIFKNQNSKVAEAVFQAAAMVYLTGGKLAKLAGQTDFTPLIGSPMAKDVASRQVYADAIDSVNAFFKQKNADLFAAAGRERLPFPSPSAKAAATSALTQAQKAYETHMLKGQVAGMSDAEIAAWTKDHAGYQAALDSARQEAWKNSVPTFHYQNGKWVPSATYSRSAAIKEANALIAKNGAITPAARMADTLVKFPSYERLSAEESKKWLANWRKENNIRAVDAAESASQTAAKEIVDNEAAYDALGLDPAETAQHMMQDSIAKPLDELNITVNVDPNSYTAWKSNVPERLSGTASREDLKPLLNRAESTMMNAVSNIADYADALRTNYLKLFRQAAKEQRLTKEEAIAFREDSFTKAFNHAIARTEPGPGEAKIVSDLTYHLRAMFDGLFGNPETSMIVKSGIDSKMLGSAFKKFGLSDKAGFVQPSALNPSQLADYLAWLPFANMPKDLGEIEKAAWNERAKAFKESNNDPFVMVTRMAQAIQFARTEKGIVSDFANQFGYKSQGLTFEQAVRQGWVQIKGTTMGGTNLADHLPAPEAGGLFNPDIAKQFMSINREWNKLYNSGSMRPWLRNAMEIQGFFKANQTIFNLRHHITNMVGDTTTAMIAGVLNPLHWGQGLELSLMYAGEDAAAQWGKNQLDKKFVQMFNSWKGYDRALETVSPTGGRMPAVTIYKNGKPTLQGIKQQDLLQAFLDRGIMVGNIFQNDIQGLSDSVLSSSLVGDRANLMKRIGAKIHKGYRAAEKGPGSMAAYYGNVPRAAHALRVMQSRSWSSLEEALNAASAEVTKYHPTIQSLSASERKGPRLMFSYYTWLRVAHNAFIDMALKHTGAMLIPSRIQYAQAEAAGLDPQNIGSPWSLYGQSVTPSYLNYSVYGPTAVGPNGPVVYRRSILPMDVLDTWNFAYDTGKTIDQNTFENLAKAGRIFGKNLNQVAQPLIEWGTGTDIQTGKPSTVKDLATFGDKLLSNFGLTNLLEGLNVYTPSNKGTTSKNPLTQEQRNAKLLNWIGGQKQSDVMTPANIKNAKLEHTARLNTILKNKGIVK
jgi:hypothetical protein